jgi:hypothetical protein
MTIVSLMHRPHFTLQKHLCWRLSKPQGLVPQEGLGKLKEFIHLIGSRTRDLPACSIVPQPLRYRVPPPYYVIYSVGQTQLGSFWSLITNQSNNTRENGKVPFVVDRWQLPTLYIIAQVILRMPKCMSIHVFKWFHVSLISTTTSVV